MRKDADIHAKNCNICQKFKITGSKKYGKIPFRAGREKIDPWYSVAVDCAGP